MKPFEINLDDFKLDDHELALLEHGALIDQLKAAREVSKTTKSDLACLYAKAKDVYRKITNIKLNDNVSLNIDFGKMPEGVEVPFIGKIGPKQIKFNIKF